MRTLTEFNSVKVNKPKGIRRINEYPNLTDEMISCGWSAELFRKILGGNWLRLPGETWR